MRPSMWTLGALSLTGALLGMTPPTSAAETTIFADNFDAGTNGAPPAGWTITGDGAAIDPAVKDGATGKSVLLASFGAFFGGSAMEHAIAPQDDPFSVRFTLITSSMPSNIVFNAGQSSGGFLAAGLGSGLGVYEDGTLGFGFGDAIQAAAPNTTYRFRVDFDPAAQQFDVTIDGTKLVTGRALGFSGTAFDLISFGGVPGMNGLAHIDSVSVFAESASAPPVANAGADQTVECVAGGASATLNGTASTASGGALTYSWSGDFDGGTASGATPTVHFSTPGAHVVTLVVNDGVNSSSPDTMTVNVSDTLPPSVAVTGLPAEIWPANHKMVTVKPAVTASDLCDGSAVSVTLAVTCNEPSDGDVVIRSASDFDLRAERTGSGSGRTYHLVWTATDASGHSAQFAADVSVPRDRRK